MTRKPLDLPMQVAKRFVTDTAIKTGKGLWPL